MENPLQKENQYTHIYVIFEEWVSHKFSSQEPYSHSPAIIIWLCKVPVTWFEARGIYLYLGPLWLKTH
jgi:hypothetical protein